MKNKFLIISIFVVIFLPTYVYAISLAESSCKDDGSFYFRITPDEGNAYLFFNESNFIKITTPKGEVLDIPANWSRNQIQLDSGSYQENNYFYQSDLLIFNRSGNYKVEFDYREYYYKNQSQTKRTYGFNIKNCPGLLFNCRFLGLNIDDCYTKDNKFYAYFTANLEKQSSEENSKFIDVNNGLKYMIEANGAYMDTTGNLLKRGKLPKVYTIKNTGRNKYLLEADFPSSSVKNLYIEYSKEPEYYFVNDCYIFNANYGNRQLTTSRSCGDKPSIELPKVETKLEKKEEVKKETVSETPKVEEPKPKEEKPAEKKEEPKFEEAKPTNYKYVWISILVITVILIAVFIIVKRKSEDNLI